MDSNTSLLSTVLFSDIQQWDVKQFFLRKIHSTYKIEELGKHLIHHTEKVQPSDFPEDDFVILGVSNKIGMFDAGIEKGKDIKQKYHIVEENWLAYNPYRVNVGSIGIKTPELKGRYISPAYIVFSCKDTLLPEFLWLMMKSSFFNSLIKDSTTGSVRQTLQFDKLACIKAPIPPIPEQERILKEYHNVLDEANENLIKGDACSNRLLFDIQSAVSDFKTPKRPVCSANNILQTVSFSATSRWEVAYILKEGMLESIYQSYKYSIRSIEGLEVSSLFGLSIKSSDSQQQGMIPMLRMPNIVNGDIDCSDLKYIPRTAAVTQKEPDKYLLQKGDFLINRTNSKELVGKAAVFNLDGEFSYASYVIRYRFNTSEVLPEYVNILFTLPIVRIQIDVLSRQTAGQCNINSEEIGSIKIPVPSIPVQRAIVQTYYSIKSDADTFYKKARLFKDKATTDFEKAIFS